MRKGWWLVPELLAVVALTTALLLPHESSLDREVAARAAALIEAASPDEHHVHGHEVWNGETVLCGVDVFGTEPARPATLAEVRVVYGYYFCAVGTPGMQYAWSRRIDGPVVVTLGRQPYVLIAVAGAGYADRVRAMMPDQWEKLCFSGLPDPAVADAVQARYIATLIG